MADRMKMRKLILNFRINIYVIKIKIDYLEFKNIGF